MYVKGRLADNGVENHQHGTLASKRTFLTTGRQSSDWSDVWVKCKWQAAKVHPTATSAKGGGLDPNNIQPHTPAKN